MINWHYRPPIYCDPYLFDHDPGGRVGCRRLDEEQEVANLGEVELIPDEGRPVEQTVEVMAAKTIDISFT